MEALPKIVYGCPEKTVKLDMVVHQGEKTSVNCNICRNFKNIQDRTHRMSKVHQKKLTERFRIIRSKMKINIDSVTVHDAEWGKEEEFYCYFCDKPVKKHESDAGFTIEFMGLMIHHTDSHHMESVKSYLKYHGRNEKFEIFCKTKPELERFMAKIPEAKRKYLKKLEILNERDVRQIRETAVERQKIVEGALQVADNVEFNEVKCDGKAQTFLQHSQILPKLKKHYTKFTEKPKIPPWLVKKPEDESNVNQSSDRPVIGPTMETLIKHVASQEKKGLSTKRIKANLKHKNIGTTKWLPAFSGVWNKGRRRQLKSNFHKK